MKFVSYIPVPSISATTCLPSNPRRTYLLPSFSAAVADIEVIADETVLSCPATGVTITVEFNVSVSSVESLGATTTGAAISGDKRCCVGYLFRGCLNSNSATITSKAELMIFCNGWATLGTAQPNAPFACGRGPYSLPMVVALFSC